MLLPWIAANQQQVRSNIETITTKQTTKEPGTAINSHYQIFMQQTYGTLYFSSRTL